MTYIQSRNDRGTRETKSDQRNGNEEDTDLGDMIEKCGDLSFGRIRARCRYSEDTEITTRTLQFGLVASPIDSQGD